MTYKEEIALNIGKHVLESFDWFYNKLKNGEPTGKELICPIPLPLINNQEPDWALSIRVELPWFVETYWEYGELKFKHWSMDEWYEKKGKIK